MASQEKIYFRATELAVQLKQTIGDKKELYVTLEQLMQIIKEANTPFQPTYKK